MESKFFTRRFTFKFWDVTGLAVVQAPRDSIGSVERHRTTIDIYDIDAGWIERLENAPVVDSVIEYLILDDEDSARKLIEGLYK